MIHTTLSFNVFPKDRVGKVYSKAQAIKGNSSINGNNLNRFRDPWGTDLDPIMGIRLYNLFIIDLGLYKKSKMLQLATVLFLYFISMRNMLAPESV